MVNVSAVPHNGQTTLRRGKRECLLPTIEPLSEENFPISFDRIELVGLEKVKCEARMSVSVDIWWYNRAGCGDVIFGQRSHSQVWSTTLKEKASTTNQQTLSCLLLPLPANENLYTIHYHFPGNHLLLLTPPQRAVCHESNIWHWHCGRSKILWRWWWICFACILLQSKQCCHPSGIWRFVHCRYVE